MPALNNATKIALLTFFSNLYFYNHIGTLYFQSRGLNLLQVSSVTSIIVASVFLAEVPTGVLADRIGRKGSVIMALLLQTLGEVLFLFAESYAAFVMIAIIAGVGFAFASGATEALVYDSLPPGTDREAGMKRAMGNVGSAYYLAFFTAPLVGGLLVTELTLSKYLLVIALTACSVLVALLIALTLDEPPGDAAQSREHPLTILRAGLGDLIRRPVLRHILLLTVFTSTFHGVLVSLYQPYFVEAGLSPFLIGAGLSAGGLLAAVAQRYIYRLPQLVGNRAGLVMAVLLPGIGYILLGLATGMLPVFLLFVLTHAALDLKKPLLSAYQNQHLDSQTRATALSLINMLASIYVAVMSLVYGALADHSLSLTFVVMGAVMIVAARLLRVDKLY
ncbi:MAG: hypothetical protein CL610_17755 [Anaerolineaceae bacterium]|nr:hypothetical protein [Anaerolineaceae bacterium]